MKIAYSLMTVVSVGVLMYGSVFLIGQEAEKKGGKALFLDTTTMVTVTSGDTSDLPPSPGGNSAPDAGVPLRNNNITLTNFDSSHVQKNKGLMYYVELIKPGGEALRVNTSRVFESGQKIKIYFQSNIDGYLFITHDQDNERKLLFPDKNVKDNRVKAFENTVVPSEKYSFTFDDNPGEIRLQVFFAAADEIGKIPDVIRSMTTSPAISNESKKKQDMLIAEAKPRGSKALKIEEDRDEYHPATYVVSDDDILVPIEIVLTHRSK